MQYIYMYKWMEFPLDLTLRMTRHVNLEAMNCYFDSVISILRVRRNRSLMSDCTVHVLTQDQSHLPTQAVINS